MKTALVTGASRGIGRALTLELTRRGVTVFATGRDPIRLADLSRESGALSQALDLSAPNGPSALYEAAKRALSGPPDFLINNAGYNSRKADFIDVTEDEFDLQYQVNFRAPALLSRLALRDMYARGSGHVVNVLSTAALHPNATMGVYTAMKKGLGGLTDVLRKEARVHGVKISSIYPGGVDTDFRTSSRPDYMLPESVATLICDAALFAPEDAVLHELVFRPMVENNF